MAFPYADLSNNELTAEAVDHLDKAQKHVTNGLAAIDKGSVAAGRELVNLGENKLITAEKRMRELLRRGCDCEHGEHEHPHPEPEPEPEPEPPVTDTTPIHLRPFAPLILRPVDLDAWTYATSLYDPRPGEEGALRFFGNATDEINYDDVLLYPGQPGRAHPHAYDGLPGVNAFSTIESMLATENTRWVGFQTMRPALWWPVPESDGQAKNPDNCRLYYKQGNGKQPVPGFPESFTWEEISRIAGPGEYHEKQARVLAFLMDYHAKAGTLHPRENIPNAMCLIGGHKMDGTPGKAEVQILRKDGNAGQWVGKTIHEAVEKMRVALGDPQAETIEGDKMQFGVPFPNHFNGQLGSDDYRSHVAVAEWGGRNFYMKEINAPASHPRTMLSVTAFRSFSQRKGEPPLSQIRLSSDMDGMEAGRTLHADYISLWPEQIRDTWYPEIIQKGVSTSTGGNTINYGGIGAKNPKHSLGGWDGQARYLPIPPRPAPPAHGQPGHHH